MPLSHASFSRKLVLTLDEHATRFWIDDYSISKERRGMTRVTRPALGGRVARVYEVTRSDVSTGGFTWNAKVTFEDCTGKRNCMARFSYLEPWS